MLLSREQSLDRGLMRLGGTLKILTGKSTFLLGVLNILQMSLQPFYRTSKGPVEPSRGLPCYLLKWPFSCCQ